MSGIKKQINCVLGFDFGEKRIGVAVGQTITAQARPLLVLSAQSGAPDWNAVQRLIDEWNPQQLVVGRPTHMTGDEGEITKAATRFSNRLHGRFNLPVELVDERLSSFEAEEWLDELPRSARKDTITVDSVAAMLIVQTWLAEYIKEDK